MTSLAGRRQRPHIDGELLTRYSLYLSTPDEPDYDGRRLTGSEIGEVEHHLGECDVCKEKVENLGNEFQEIELYLEKAGLDQITLGAESNRSVGAILTGVSETVESVFGWLKDRVTSPLPRFAPLAVGAMAALMLIIWAGPFLIQSDLPYATLASLDGEKFTSRTRSAGTPSLTDGLQAFHQKQYRQAISAFEQFISQGEADPNLPYAHYLAGVSYLVEAKETLFGRVKGFDRSEVDTGISHLRVAARLTDSRGLQEDCQWYIAKAHLMNEEGAKAREILEQLVDLRGRRFRDARNLISEIDRVSQSE